MNDLESKVRSVLHAAITGQVEERVSLAAGVLMRAIEAEQDRQPVESWVPAPGECLSDRVAERVTYWRKRRGMNRQQLADACASLGMPKLTFESFSNIESGRPQDGVRRRMVTIDEVAVIAAALRVSPLVLVEPVSGSGSGETEKP